MRHCGRISGKPFQINFHPHLNTVIGGRGAGKSTALESIRIASRRDQNLAMEAPRVKEELDKFMKPAQEIGVMLENTEIQLELFKRNENYLLNWRFDGRGSVLKEKTVNGWEERDAVDLSGRFPVSIYSQKQINELASNPRGLLGIIDRSKEVNRAEWKSRWDITKSQFLQLRERQRELLRLLAGEKEIRIKLEDIKRS